MWLIKSFPSITAVLICLLTACAKDNIAPPKTIPAAEPPKVGIKIVPLAPEAPEPKQRAVRPRIDNVPNQVKSRIDNDPNQLLGHAPSGVKDRLGLPNFVRRDGPAEIWQYLAKACIIDVFMYRKGKTLKVDYVELRGRGAATSSRHDCFVAILSAQLHKKID